MSRRLTLLLLFLLSPLGGASGLLAQLIPPENSEPWSYVGAPLEGNCLQTYRLYLPDPQVLEMPPGGWPVLVYLDLKAFAITIDQVADENNLFGRLLDVGFAVVVARSTPSLETDSDAFDIAFGAECNDEFGEPPDWPGHGLFHAPGIVPPDLVGSGVAPYDSSDYFMCEKDAVMLVQHVRHLARKTAPFANMQDELMSQLDHRRIAVRGTSAGSAALMWAALGPDRRNEAPFAGLGGQFDEPTQPHMASFGGAPMWWPIFRPDLLLAANHFGDQGHSELPGALLGDASTEELLAASPLFYADPLQLASFPMYLHYKETSICEDYLLNTDPSCMPYPFCFDDQGFEGVNGIMGGSASMLHPSWAGFTWKTQNPLSTRLVIYDAGPFSQAGVVQAVPLFGSTLDQDTDIILWLGDRADELLSWVAAPVATATPGTKIRGLLPEDGVHSVEMDAVAGSKLSVKVNKKAGSLQPALRVIAPDGSWLVASAEQLGNTKASKKKASTKKLVLPQTGSYRVEALGASLEGGEYRLGTKLSAPGKFKQLFTVGLDDGAESFQFDAVAGSLLSSAKVSQVKPPKGAPSMLAGLPAGLLPQIVSVTPQGGEPLNLTGLVALSKSGKTLKLSGLTLPVTGTYSLTLGGDMGTVGYASMSMKLKRPKPDPLLEIF